MFGVKLKFLLFDQFYALNTKYKVSDDDFPNNC